MKLKLYKYSNSSTCLILTEENDTTKNENKPKEIKIEDIVKTARANTKSMADNFNAIDKKSASQPQKENNTDTVSNDEENTK